MKKLGLGFLALLCLSQISSAEVFNVSSVTELKNAIQQAGSNGEEDTINLDGKFKLDSTLEIYQNDEMPITIQGVNGKATLTNKNGRILAVEHGTAPITLKNIIFKNGKSNNEGAGVFFSGVVATDLTIENCEFKGNEGHGYGGGLSIITEGKVVIKDSKFVKNKAYSSEKDDGKGGGAYIVAESMEIKNCTFENNFAEKKGGGLFLGEGYNVIVENNLFKNNEVKYKTEYEEDFDPEDIQGGAVYIDGGDIEFNNNIVEKNENNGVGGGLCIEKGNNVNLSNNLFSKNESLLYGSAVLISDADDVTVSNNVFEKNKGYYLNVEDEKYSCGTLAVEGYSLSVNGNKFEKNSNVAGSAICLNVETFKALNNTFEKNRTDWIGGGAVFGETYTASLKNNIFEKNGSKKVKKFKDDEGNPYVVGIMGGAVSLYSYEGAEITDNIFNNNEAGFTGGALFLATDDIENFDSVSKVTGLKSIKKIFKKKKLTYDRKLEDIDEQILIKNNKFYKNSTNYMGGAISLYSNFDVNIENNEFIKNTVKEKGKNIPSLGGGLWIVTEDSNLNIINNMIAENSSGVGAGGVSVKSSGFETINFISNTIYKNKAKTMMGGAYFYLEGGDVASSNVNVYNNILYGNKAKMKRGEDLALQFLTPDQNASLDLMNNLFDEGTDFNNPEENFYIEGFTTYNHNNNITGNPELDKTYHLTSKSIAIDAGNNDAPLLSDKDIDNQSRIFNGIIDIGADEYNDNPILVSSTNSINFGSFEVGTESKNEKIKITNKGIGKLIISSIVLTGDNPNDFEITKDKCTGKILKRGKSCEIKVRFKPMSEGDKLANLEINSNDPNSPTIIELFGSASSIPPGEIEVNPTTVDFESYGVGYVSKKKTIKVRNVTDNSNGKLIIKNVAIAGADADQFEIYKDKCTGKVLKRKKSCEIKVRFKPTTVGDKFGVLVIESNDVDEPEVDVDLIGKGEGGNIYVKPENYNFGNVDVGDYKKKTFKVKNIGKGILNISNIVLAGADADQFEIYKDKCTGKSLKKGKSCEIKVRFMPTTVGEKTAILQINSDDIDTPTIEVQLEGNGT